jgi:signal transduction histidine kinase
MFGVPDEIETNYDLLMSLMHDEDRERVVTMADAAFREQALYGTEFRIIWPDGTERWIAATGRGIYDDEGNAVRLAGVVIDVTDERHADDQQRFFVEAAAHDLKGPLTTIKGQSQLMRRRLQRNAGGAPSSLTGGLDAIDDATDKAILLIHELLDAAHLRAGRALDLDRHLVDLVDIARAVATDLARTTNNHSIRVEAGSDQVVILGDSIRIERVVGNLITNAIKYSPDGGEILVTVARDDSDPQPWATVTVKDQGVGIPTIDLPHIFERYRRGSNVGAIGGAGVGLAGVRQIIEQHDGTVAVESEERRGSTFTLRVPLAAATA